ncbi:MAG: DUF63 family protein [Candidatus Methanofastidiosia archaeon]
MIPEFIEDFFVDPIKSGGGYNVVNTLTYTLILVVVVCLVYYYFGRKIVFHQKAYYAISLFILVGASARVVKDMGISDSYLLVTPLIYILTFGIACTLLVVTVLLWKKDYYKYMAIAALCLFGGIILILVANAEAFNTKGFFYIVTAAVACSLLVYYVARHEALTFVTNNMEIMGGHILDASATFFGIALFGYFEQHLVPGFFIKLFGTPFVMFPLKITVIGIILYLIKDIEEEGFKNLLKLIVLALGAAPAVRDLLRIMLMT